MSSGMVSPLPASSLVFFQSPKQQLQQLRAPPSPSSSIIMSEEDHQIGEEYLLRKKNEFLDLPLEDTDFISHNHSTIKDSLENLMEIYRVFSGKQKQFKAESHVHQLQNLLKNLQKSQLFAQRFAKLGNLLQPQQDYNLLRILVNRTCYGKVWLAQHKDSDSMVVIKMSEKKKMYQSIYTEHTVEDPLREIVMQSNLNEFIQKNETKQYQLPGSNYLCRLVDVRNDEANHTLWTVTPYYKGGDLFHYVALYSEAEHGMEEWRAKAFFRQILEGLYFMHRIWRVSHMDMSLENVLLNEEKSVSTLCDLGAARPLLLTQSSVNDARFLEMECEAIKGHLPGKLDYFSPELYSRKTFHPTLNDMHAAGVILFMMLVGAKPWTRPDESDAGFRIIYSGQLAALLQAWKRPVSNDALDLLNHLLCFESAGRFSVEEALMHPWLRSEMSEAVLHQPNSVYHHMEKRGYTVYRRVSKDMVAMKEKQKDDVEMKANEMKTQ
jgi:serine/threonine protein kinase